MATVKDLHNECAKQKTECFKSRSGKLPNNKSDNVAMQKKIAHIQTQLNKNKADAKDKLEKAKSDAKNKIDKVKSDAKEKLDTVKEKQAKVTGQQPKKRKPEKKNMKDLEDLRKAGSTLTLFIENYIHAWDPETEEYNENVGITQQKIDEAAAAYETLLPYKRVWPLPDFLAVDLNASY